MNETTISLTSRTTGMAKVVRTGDPVWCSLDNTRVRFLRQIDPATVEVMNDEGRILPDYRHVSQVAAI